MRILLPLPDGLIMADRTNNPYISLLVEALRRKGDVVELSLKSFYDCRGDFDVVNIHWPERLIADGIDYDVQINNLKVALEYWAKKSILVLTVHNLEPHYRKSKVFKEVYRLVIEFSYVYVHFGRSAMLAFEDKYRVYVLGDKRNEIIYHGDYKVFLGANDSVRVGDRIGLISVGDLRTFEEYKLLVFGFLYGFFKNPKRLKLTVIGPLPFKSRANPLKYGILFLSRVLELVFPIRFISKRISSEELGAYVSINDALVIVRPNTLNSGNIYLGLTFGKLLIIPDYGLFKEFAEMVPVVGYLRNSFVSLGDRLASIDNFDLKSVKEEYLRFVDSELSWDKIGNDYLKMFANAIAHRVTPESGMFV